MFVITISLLLLFFTSQMHSMLLILKIEFASSGTHNAMVQFSVCDSVTGCLLYRYSFIRSFVHIRMASSLMHTHSVWTAKRIAIRDWSIQHACYAFVTRSRAIFLFHFDGHITEIINYHYIVHTGTHLPTAYNTHLNSLFCCMIIARSTRLVAGLCRLLIEMNRL